MMLPVKLLILFLISATSLRRANGSSAPQFVVAPSDLLVATGQPVELRCSVSGDPRPSIAWFKDGLSVSLGGVISQDVASGSLLISSVRDSDAGAYHCTASNDFGSLQSLVAYLEIASLGSLPPTPTPATGCMPVVPNEPVVLQCILPDSLPAALVTWSPSPPSNSARVGVTLEGSLVFSYWDTAIDGLFALYSCSVSNPLIAGQAVEGFSNVLCSTGAVGEVFNRVQFVPGATPQPRTVVEGAMTQFQCFTTGRAEATISWDKDGTSLTGSDRVVFSQGNRVLTIPEALRTDAGVYRCTAEQSSAVEEIMLTSEAQLTVRVPPAQLSVFPATSVNISESVSLACATDGDTPLSWQWRFNTQTVVPSDRVQINSEGQVSTLVITEAEQSDAGVYQCIVSQPDTGYENAASNLLSTAMLAPSVVGGPPVDQLVLEDDTVTFPCSATGFPPPTFTWYRAGQRIDTTIMNRYSLPLASPGNGSLTVSPTQVSDSSTLQCNASNAAGFALADPVQLVVTSAPVILQAPVDVTATPGQQVALPCEVAPLNGIDSITYSWRRDTVVVHISAGGVLTLPNVSDQLSGFYECVVLLSVNSINAPPLEFLVGSAVVTVGGPATPPSPPLNPTASGVSTISFLAHWEPPLDNGRLPIQNYTVELLSRGNGFCNQGASPVEWQPVVQGIEAGVLMAEVASLVPFTGYQFRVVAFNSVFRSQPSASSMLVQTSEAAPSIAPSQLEVQPQEDFSQLLVTWQPLTDCTAAGGIITGYTVRYRGEEEQVFAIASTDQLELILEDLASSTRYQVQVAAQTSTGIGPYTTIVMATTCNEPPANVEVSSLNSTAVLLSWESLASSSGDGGIAGFSVTYTSTDGGSSGVLTLNATQMSVVISSLSPGEEYLFTVAISGECASSSASTSVSFTLPSPEKGAFYEQTWFLAVVPSVGVIVLVVLLLLLGICCFTCCYRCSSDSGKIYISSRRSVSSMSASSGFSEYQHKHKVMSRFVKVHDSPTPSRRSTDYADLDSVRPNIGSSPNSVTNTGSVQSNGRLPSSHTTTIVGGGVNVTDGYNHMLEKPDVHVRQMSGGSTQQFFDTMHRVHTPPLPMSDDLNTTASSAQMSDSATEEEPWNPTENLNYRGHMSNLVSRTNSERSSQSSECGAGRFVRVQLQPQKPQFVAANVHNLHNDLRYPDHHFTSSTPQQAMSLQEIERHPTHQLPYPPHTIDVGNKHRDPHRDQLPPAPPHTLPGYNNNPRMMSDQRIQGNGYLVQHATGRMEPISSPQLQTLHETHPDEYLTPPPAFQAGEKDILSRSPPPLSNSWYADHPTTTSSHHYPQAPATDDIDMPENFSSSSIAYHPSNGGVAGGSTRGNRPIAVQQYNKLRPLQVGGGTASQPVAPPPTYGAPTKHEAKKNHWNGTADSTHQRRFDENGRTKPKIAPKPTHITRPDLVHNNIAINRVPTIIPDLTSIDPRKPQLKQGKVPRAIWEQKPMNRAIESSSESDYASDSDSLDTVVPDQDNASLKSSHV